MQNFKSDDLTVHVKNWFSTRFDLSSWGWLESVIITLLILGAGFYLSPSDPFFIHAPFPWTWLAPILIALRYGVGPAFLSVMIIIAVYAYVGHYGNLEPSLYKIYFLGGMIITLICGEFSAQWAGRVKRAEQLSSYAEERLENLSKVYFITRISHDRLEQNLISKPVTLRNTLESMRSLLVQHAGKLDETTAHQLLLLLSQHCSLISAGIYPVEGKEFNTNNTSNFFQKIKDFTSGNFSSQEKDIPDKHAKFFNTGIHLSDKPVACLGPEIKLSVDDILVQKSLEAKQLAYFSIGELSDEIHSEYIVSIPICSTQGVIYGVLVIKDMPFLSLNFETLQTLVILIAYYGYEIDACHAAKNLLAKYPSCPPDFAAELNKLVQLKLTTNTSSSLVAIYLKPSPQREDMILQLSRQVRGIDYLWHTQKSDIDILITLMPFSDMNAINGYINRIEQWLKDNFAVDAHESQFIKVHYTSVHGDNAIALIDYLMEQTNEA